MGETLRRLHQAARITSGIGAGLREAVGVFSRRDDEPRIEPRGRRPTRLPSEAHGGLEFASRGVRSPS